MSRPIGVTLVALAVAGFSAFVVSRTMAFPMSARNRPLFITAGLLVFLALVAGEALWSLRAHAFLVFMAWGLCAMVAVALVGLRSPGGAHGVRILPQLVYVGLGLAATALYLRRAV
jgi:hypothetical protein